MKVPKEISTNGQQILDKGVIQCIKIVFSTNGAGTTGCLHTKNTNNLDLTLQSSKINSKWIFDPNLNVKL